MVAFAGNLAGLRAGGWLRLLSVAGVGGEVRAVFPGFAGWPGRSGCGRPPWVGGWRRAARDAGLFVG